GASMYITSFPCLICMRAIVAAGIKKVIYMNDFYKPHHMDLFTKNRVKVKQIAEDKVRRKRNG
ncbi:MAG: ComE operon protein 2, partial [Candidatus Magasanikbacteria bacterium GW2011_GWA2_45_39]